MSASGKPLNVQGELRRCPLNLNWEAVIAILELQINTLQEECSDGTKVSLRSGCAIRTGHLNRCAAGVENVKAEETHLFEPTISMIAENSFIVAQIVSMRNGLYDLFKEHHDLGEVFEPQGHDVGVLKQIDLTETNHLPVYPSRVLQHMFRSSQKLTRQARGLIATYVIVEAECITKCLTYMASMRVTAPADYSMHRYACSYLVAARPENSGLVIQPDMSMLEADWTCQGVLTWVSDKGCAPCVMSSVSDSLKRGNELKNASRKLGAAERPGVCAGKPCSISNKRVYSSSFAICHSIWRSRNNS